MSPRRDRNSSTGPCSPGVPDASFGSTRTGFVHAAVLADYADLSGYDVYASGPPAMVESIRTSFAAQGLPREQLYFDSFDYAPDTVARMKASQSALRS
jgi:CDP-4-dehydro-6-deoxyglucose reductase